MGIYSEAPAYRTFSDDKPTLLVCWWCTMFAATVIFFRVCGRYIRTERLFTEDWLAFACLIPLFIRMGLVQVILLYGTNNSLAPDGGFTDDEIMQRRIGSRLVLASRIFYAATLWMLKLTITEFFKRLTFQIWKRSYEHMLRGIRWFLLATFVAIIISDLAECQPVTSYWQVNATNPPVEPQCRQGMVQLLTMGICNVITDILLIIFPIPIIIRSQMTLKRKIQLVLLFSLSIVPVGITLYRIPNIIAQAGVQQYRSVWASVEILLATGAANALVLGSFVRDRGIKKHKWKFGSMSESLERTSTRRGTVVQMHWGSDEDLVRDMGMSVDPELRGSVSHQTVRLAPMAHSASTPLDQIREGWAFPDGSGHQAGTPSRTSNDSHNNSGPYRDQEPYPPAQRSPGEVSSTPSRKVSFFDIGGLLDDHDPMASRRRPSQEDTASMANSFASHEISPSNSRVGTAASGGSQALLMDVGGLLSPSPQRYSSSTNGRSIIKPWSRGRMGSAAGAETGFELQSIPQGSELNPMSNGNAARSNGHATAGGNLGQPLARQETAMSLQDVGGLLK